VTTVEQSGAWRGLWISGLLGRFMLLCMGVWLHAADSLVARLERFCSGPCAAGYLRYEATMARAHGYPGTADSLMARAGRVEAQ